MKHTLDLVPRDLLFLRDARPMEASDAGLGANWPRPDQLYHALLSAFRLRWPERQDWEGEEHTRRDESKDVDFRFGALKTFGPFPKKDGKVYFPRPLDLGMKLVKCEGTDLPAPLEYAFLPAAKGKASLPQWVSSDTMEKYLAGGMEFKLEEKDSDLFGADRNIGIAIDPATGTTVDGKLYQAEYLRLQEGVSLVCEASCDMKLKRHDTVLDAYDPAQTGNERVEQVVLGGQQGMCSLSIADGELALPKRPETQAPTKYVRWTLLTPAVFQAGKEPDAKEGEPPRKQTDPIFGWLPAWCLRTDADRVYRDEIGKVMLARPVEPRRAGESRQDWKARQKAAGTINAKLVAARVDKPVAFSGWDLSLGPKPTMLAVPAGSCYVFECATTKDAEDLVAALDGVPRSDLLGSNGFGIGVCSFVECPTP